MRQMRVWLATCRVLPEPDPDQEPLLRALADLGVEARLLAWDDPAAPAPGAEPIVVRSTWNYFRDPASFLAWLDRVAAAAPVYNPPAILRWNIDKHYLHDLGQRGVSVVPTAFVGRGETAALGRLMDERGWSEVVVKPRIAAGSFGARRFTREQASDGERFLAEWLTRRDMMVQPYLRSVEDYGERALIWIDGALTHAVRKSPRFHGGDESVSAAMQVAPDEAALATAALQDLAPQLLYARIDVARGPDGTPCIMELELLELSLFLLQHPPALSRFADAIRARCR